MWSIGRDHEEDPGSLSRYRLLQRLRHRPNLPVPCVDSGIVEIYLGFVARPDYPFLPLFLSSQQEPITCGRDLVGCLLDFSDDGCTMDSS